MKLKHTQKHNTEYLWQSYEKAMKAHIESIWGWDLAWQQIDFTKNLTKYTTSLITKKDKTIGYLQYNIDDNKGYINMLILEPSQQSQGFGAEALNYLTTIHHLETLSLRCFKVNTRAYRFYKGEGFEMINEDENFYLLRKTV